MNVLITGGAGYIGTELTYRLCLRENVEQIMIYDNLSRPNYNLFTIPEGPQLDKVRFFLGDVLDSRKLRNTLRNVDVVYHLAARVTTPYSDESAHLYEQVNHWGTAELVGAVEESGVSRFVFASSASVYGFSDDVVDVDTPPHPKTYYGAAKMRAEEHVRRLGEKLHTYIVRCANVYGYSKSMRFDAVINRFLFAAHVGQPMTVQGSGNQVRSFVNIVNVASCLDKLLDANLPPGTHNLVDRNISILENTDAMQQIYPEVETLFVSQHVEPRHLRLALDGSLGARLQVTTRDFAKELEEFALRLAISPAMVRPVS